MNVLSGWDATLLACQGRLDPRKFVEEALRARAEGRQLALAVINVGRDGLAGVTSFDTASARARHAVVGRTYLLDVFGRRKTRLEAKYLKLRCAFDEWDCEAVTVRAPWQEQLSSSDPGDEAQEEVSVVHQIMEDTGRFGDMSGFEIARHEWPMLKIKLEGRIGRLIQRTHL
ncbi:hypothetical protein [Piscinibacter sp. HJYY11]|uniref:hypothetical protein n=1 Tax=Piscinibacter sp. HJYY11 TaxID=2801333 RepID=UPI00191F3225|nr:hypothetical protein [Piscinibacter sp. HJYY11]MBL0729437.1 hypothetical protein [Piscinibacter sp. HJYY11]